MEAWWCYRQFFLPSDWQRILLFSSSFSCFRRAFSSSRSEIRYGTRQGVTAGCRAELLWGLISPGRRQGALFGLSLLFKRSVPPCFATYPLYTRSRSTTEMHCYNRVTFPFLSALLPYINSFRRILQNTEQLDLAATICRSKGLASDQVIKSEVYFYMSIGFMIFFKPQHWVTAAGETNLLIFPEM